MMTKLTRRLPATLSATVPGGVTSAAFKTLTPAVTADCCDEATDRKAGDGERGDEPASSV